MAILTLKACIFRSTENFGPKSFKEWYPTYLRRIWSWNELWQHINICQANLNIAHLLHKQGLVETQLLRTVCRLKYTALTYKGKKVIRLPCFLRQVLYISYNVNSEGDVDNKTSYPVLSLTLTYNFVQFSLKNSKIKLKA